MPVFISWRIWDTLNCVLRLQSTWLSYHYDALYICNQQVVIITLTSGSFCLWSPAAISQTFSEFPWSSQLFQHLLLNTSICSHQFSVFEDTWDCKHSFPSSDWPFIHPLVDNAVVAEERMLLLACYVIFLIQPRPNFLYITPPTMSWVLPYQVSIKRTPTDLPTN